MQDKEWFNRQTKLAAAATAKWPEWMKKEAGIGQQTTSSAVATTESGSSRQEAASAPTKK